MKKKVTAILCCVLAVVCAAAFAGCRGNDPNNPDGGNGEAKVTLKIWSQMGNEVNFFAWATKRYKELKPNVTINVTPQSTATLGTGLDASLGKNTVDIVATWGGLVVPKLVKGKKVLKLNDVITSEVEAKLNDSAKINKIDSGDNNWYSLPFSGFASPVVFYNKDYFDSLQIEEPKTYEELKTAAGKIRAAGDKDTLVSGFGDWPLSHFMQAMHARTMTKTDYDGLIGINTERNPFESKTEAGNPVSGLTQGFELLKKYQTDGIFGRNLTGYNSDTAKSYFTQGKAAMYAAPSLDFLSMTGSANFNIGAFVLPEATTDFSPSSDKNTTLVSGIFSDVFVVDAGTKYPNECKDFLKFLISEEAQAKLLDLFLFPVINGISTDSMGAKYKESFEKVLGSIYSEIQKGCTGFYQSYSIGQMDGRLKDLAQSVLAESSSVNTASAAAALNLVNFYKNSGHIKK